MAKAPPPKERAVQREILQVLRKCGLRVVHIPNGAHLSGTDEQRIRQWGALLGDGAVPGFPDLLIMARNPARAGFLEVKRIGGKADDRQLACHAAIEADGFPLSVVRSVEDALAAVKSWGFL